MIPDAYSLPTASLTESTASGPTAEPQLAGFPYARALLAAIRRPFAASSEPELARWAHRLGVLYDQCDDGPLSREARREVDKVICEVNQWVTRHVGRGIGGATMAPVSLGEVLARLARAEKKRADAKLPESLARSVWRRLAQQVQAYEDLVRGLEAGTFDLPDYLPEIDWS